MRKLTSVPRARQLARKAFQSDALNYDPYEPGSAKWDVSGDCSQSRRVTLEGRPGQDVSDRRVISYCCEDGRPMFVDIDVRCRKCANCRKAHAWTWAAACEREIRLARRTWFVTLTCSPQERTVMRLCAQSKEADFEALDDSAQFAALARELGERVTAYVKRSRKRVTDRAKRLGEDGNIRYLCVFEAHKDGFPHAHLCVHEQEGSGTILWSDLTETWTAGFSQCKLIDNAVKGAWYACKYLTKGPHARVRASQGYGCYQVSCD